MKVDYAHQFKFEMDRAVLFHNQSIANLKINSESKLTLFQPSALGSLFQSSTECSLQPVPDSKHQPKLGNKHRSLRNLLGDNTVINTYTDNSLQLIDNPHFQKKNVLDLIDQKPRISRATNFSTVSGTRRDFCQLQQEVLVTKLKEKCPSNNTSNRKHQSKSKSKI